MELKTLIEQYKSNKAEPSQEYDRLYTEVFEPIRNDVNHFLEIGLALAKHYSLGPGQVDTSVPTSLRIWLDYFPNADVVGFDIKDFSFVDVDRMQIYQGDQGSEEDLLQILRDEPEPFDAIVDDGSHVSKHQQLTLECLFPAVRPGGYFCIEDLHITFDWDTVESGIRTYELISRWMAGDWHNPGMRPERFDYLKANIASMRFNHRHNLVVIEKRL